MTILIVILLFLFLALLLYGASLTVGGLRKLTATTHAGVFAISAVLLGLATSFPELSVAIKSGLSGNSALSLGNILGANIANLTLVAGGAALIAGKIKVEGSSMIREIIATFLAGLAPLLFLLDGQISGLEGIILIAFWVGYVLHFFHFRFARHAQVVQEEKKWHRFIHQKNLRQMEGEVIHLLIGIALMVAAAEVVVRLAIFLSTSLGISLFVIGVIILAIGTTLSELIFSFRSILAGESKMLLGNIMGAIVANSTLVVGVAALFSPIVTPFATSLMIGLIFILAYLLFWYFIGATHEINRFEGGVLLLLYLIFILVVVVR